MTIAAGDAGAQLIAAGRNQHGLAATYADEPGITTETVDLTDEASIAVLGQRLGAVDHVVSTASARARGRLADLDRDAVRRSLALELAPIRVSAISPGVIDTGAWDAFGERGKANYFDDISARNPVRRIGTEGDIADGVLFAMTSPFLTSTTLHIDGGEPLT